MEYKRFKDTIVARIDKGEEIVEKILEIANSESIKLASISGLGATNDFVVGLFDIDEKKYYSTNYTGNFEIVSLTGTISTKEGAIYHHIHMSAGDKENKVFGGHLNSAIVSATCEVVIRVIDGVADREFNDEIGLNLFKF